MKQHFADIKIETEGRGFTDFTDEVARELARAKLTNGLCTLHVRHTSASLLIQENADPDVRRDLEAWMARIVPDGDRLFIHTAEGPDDMPAHVRSALTCVNLSIPFQHGRLGLGTWQGIYLWEHRRHPHRRTINVHFIGE
ncbi:MAG TPA: secondary thiamine-phosphate synthase enzyme YjbQ [Verrucomicrobiae bacterium]|nr:secondary thiamine-phosphate synthase enzyme YjbQ [Verrucomicrobiae bacterium]